MRTRPGPVGLLFAAALAAALTACGGDGASPERTAAGSPGDIAILNAALAREREAAAAYAALAPRVRGAAGQTVARIGRQRRDHADGLAEAITNLGGEPSRGAARPGSAPAAVRMRSPAEGLRLAVALAERAIAAHQEELPKLTRPELRATAAAMQTNDAQHVSLLRRILDMEPAPEAFVGGPPGGGTAGGSGGSAALDGALRLAQAAVVTYQTGLDRGLLDRRMARLARRFREHRKEHVAALTAAGAASGGRPPPALAPRDVQGLAAATTRDRFLDFAIALERTAVGAHYEAAQRLGAPGLRLNASIMGSVGQHLAVLREAGGENPIPGAFETGEA